VAVLRSSGAPSREHCSCYRDVRTTGGPRVTHSGTSEVRCPTRTRVPNIPRTVPAQAQGVRATG
jgi:hypothetical protein